MKVLEASTSISFKNILFLTDFKDTSRAAFTYATAFARQFNAHIFPAHAVVPYLPTELEVPTMPDILNQIEAQAREQLAKMVKDTSLEYTALVTQEAPEDAVPHWSREHGIDLIVTGTHGRKGFERLLLGSTAETIFRQATCPVLTVGPAVPPQPGKELSIRNILFATDLSRPTESAISYAVSLALERHARLTLLHVLPEGTREYGDRARLIQFVMDELRRLVPDSADFVTAPEFMIKEGDPAGQIIEYARKNSHDLIVLGLPKNKQFNTHFRTGVTYKVISTAPAAVLTVRDLS